MFDKPIRELTCEDVRAFCEQGEPEGYTLDYKVSLPENIKVAKLISSMANTYGGTIIVGINAPAGNPLSPYEGISLLENQKIEEQIENIVLTHIQEPIVPEIHICPADERGRTFLIIRVPQSHQAPHRIAEKIYVRTRQTTHYVETEAEWERIQWLIQNRKQSEDLREDLIRHAGEYFKNVYKFFSGHIHDGYRYPVVFSMAAIPFYPSDPLVPYRDLDRIILKLQVRTRGSPFPFDVNNSEAVQLGLQRLNVKSDDKSLIDYLSINSYGLYFYKRSVGVVDDEGKKRVWFSNIEFNVKSFFDSFITFYQNLKFHGSLQLKFDLHFGPSVICRHPLFPSKYSDKPDFIVPSDHIGLGRVENFREIESKREVMIEDIIAEIAWSMGFKEHR